MRRFIRLRFPWEAQRVQHNHRKRGVEGADGWRRKRAACAAQRTPRPAGGSGNRIFRSRFFVYGFFFYFVVVRGFGASAFSFFSRRFFGSDSSHSFRRRKYSSRFSSFFFFRFRRLPIFVDIVFRFGCSAVTFSVGLSGVRVYFSSSGGFVQGAHKCFSVFLFFFSFRFPRGRNGSVVRFSGPFGFRVFFADLRGLIFLGFVARVFSFFAGPHGS
jgi:hypothetical protein